VQIQEPMAADLEGGGSNLRSGPACTANPLPRREGPQVPEGANRGILGGERRLVRIRRPRAQRPLQRWDSKDRQNATERPTQRANVLRRYQVLPLRCQRTPWQQPPAREEPLCEMSPQETPRGGLSTRISSRAGGKLEYAGPGLFAMRAQEPLCDGMPFKATPMCEV